MKTLVYKLSCMVCPLLLAACASSGPQRYQSFFQALDLSKEGEHAQAREGFETACAQNSSAACHRIGRSVEPALPLPIVQGVTSDTATEVVLWIPPEQEAQVLLWDFSKDLLFVPSVVTPIVLSQGEGQGTGRLVQQRYEGLLPGVKYQLQVVGGAGELLDARELGTLDLTRKNAVLAVASCMDTKHPLQKQMWDDLASQGPDVIFLIGDNVYAASDQVGGMPVPPATLWRRYLETRLELEIFKIPRLVPIFAVWDDNDYGQKDGDRTYAYQKESKEVFHAFFGAAEYPGIFDRGPGIASRLNGFGQRFFFLDDRSFRSPVGDGNSETHFGADQEAWFFTDLLGDAPVWIISGDQFFGGYHPFESYEGRHPKSFKRFLRRLQTQTAPAVFLSGDRHLTEIMEIPADVLGYKTYEITSSSIHASVYPGGFEQHPNPRQVDGVDGVNNYVIIETQANPTLSVTVRAYGPQKRKLYSRSFEVHRAN